MSIRLMKNVLADLVLRVNKNITSDIISSSTGLPIKWIAKHFNTTCDGTMVGYYNLYNVKKMSHIVASKLALPRINKNPKQAYLCTVMLTTLQEYLNTY